MVTFFFLRRTKAWLPRRLDLVHGCTPAPAASIITYYSLAPPISNIIAGKYCDLIEPYSYWYLMERMLHIYRQIELAADRIRERGTPHFQDRTEESLHLTTSEPARSLSPSLFRFHVNSYGRQARDRSSNNARRKREKQPDLV